METTERIYLPTKNDKYRVPFIVVLVILIVFVVAVIILIIVGYFYYQRIKAAFLRAFYNTRQCIQEPFKCKFIRQNLIRPIIFNQIFNKDLALLGTQLGMNLEFLQENGGDLNVPSFLKFINYIRGCPECDFPRGFKDDPIPFGYATLDEETRTLYLTFRGAVTNQDWQFAFSVAQRFIEQNELRFGDMFPAFFASGSIAASGSASVVCSALAKVHAGMYALFNNIRAEIDEIIQQNYDKFDRIVFFGHSLGGGVSSIAATYLTWQYPDKQVFAYTYGKPRVGNIEYANCVDSLMPGRFWRVENNDDIMTSLPLATTPNWENPDEPFLYQQEGNPIVFESNWGAQTLNHNLNSYIEGIKNLP